MEASERAQYYIARAIEAEQYATETSDRLLSKTWIKIAISYRDLADFAQSKSVKDFDLEPPPSQPISSVSDRN